MQGSFYLDRDRFLSTPSARRATIQIVAHRWPSCYFYPRPPRGGRHGRPAILQRHGKISIHALREEGDALRLLKYASSLDISIHALREEGDTSINQAAPVNVKISIHALREEGDALSTSKPTSSNHFYPRPPRGGRLHQRGDGFRGIHYFYPRPPRGGRPASLPPNR